MKFGGAMTSRSFPKFRRLDMVADFGFLAKNTASGKKSAAGTGQSIGERGMRFAHAFQRNDAWGNFRVGSGVETQHFLKISPGSWEDQVDFGGQKTPENVRGIFPRPVGRRNLAQVVRLRSFKVG